jgi:hypothetical protein
VHLLRSTRRQSPILTNAIFCRCPGFFGGKPAPARIGRMDVSDGLVGDLAKLAAASGVGASIDAKRVPLSEAARALVLADAGLIETILTGGDDYEIAATIPENRLASFQEAATGRGRSHDNRSHGSRRRGKRDRPAGRAIGPETGLFQPLLGVQQRLKSRRNALPPIASRWLLWQCPAASGAPRGAGVRAMLPEPACAGRIPEIRNQL